LFKGEFWSVGGVHRINQAVTDGALARFFSVTEFRSLVEELFVVENVMVTGQKTDAIPLPYGRIKVLLVQRASDRLTRFVTDTLRFGTFLIVNMRRI
jgi:hypothetical protein